mgnify:FL=1
MRVVELMDSYFTPYPTHITVPDTYWVSTHDVIYIEESDNGSSSL